MIGLVMAGGKGSRMKTQEEKLLLKHVHPTILHVIHALQNTNHFSKIVAATSSNSPKTKKVLENTEIEIFPLLDDKIIKKIVNLYNSEKIWTSFLVTKDFLQSIGLTSDFPVRFENKECCFTGISIVNAKEINNLDLVEENYCILDDKRIGMNLNTYEDYKLLSTS